MDCILCAATTEVVAYDQAGSAIAWLCKNSWCGYVMQYEDEQEE